MAFCGKCGTQVNDGVRFCPGCGAAIEAAAAPQQQAQPQQVYQQPVQPNYQQTVQPNYQQPPQPGYQQPPSQPAMQPVDPAQDAQQNKTMAVLAYIIFFIPLITGDHKKSPFVRFHANQGTVLFLTMVAYGIVQMILNAILFSLLFSAGGWGVWSAVTLILSLLWFVPAIFCILGIVHAVKGEMKPLPLIGKIKIIK